MPSLITGRAPSFINGHKNPRHIARRQRGTAAFPPSSSVIDRTRVTFQTRNVPTSKLLEDRLRGNLWYQFLKRATTCMEHYADSVAFLHVVSCYKIDTTKFPLKKYRIFYCIWRSSSVIDPTRVTFHDAHQTRNVRTTRVQQSCPKTTEIAPAHHLASVVG
jgi:hypothetical protein